jgi:hypothetical protein
MSSSAAAGSTSSASTIPAANTPTATASAWPPSRALVAGIFPSRPGFLGFLVTIHALTGAPTPPFLLGLDPCDWFVGFGFSFALCPVLRKLAPNT